jgi:Cu(I)/Ag(I) efflux system membrane fusion protein
MILPFEKTANRNRQCSLHQKGALMSWSQDHPWSKRIALAALPVALVGACYLLGSRSVHGHTVPGESPSRTSVQSGPLQPTAYEPSATGMKPLQGLGTGMVRIDPDKQQLIGVRVEPVENSGGTVVRHFSGSVVPQDPLVYRVTIGVDGWVKKAYDGSIGSQVKKGEKLASFWSPEFTTAINSYLVATDRSGVQVKQASTGIDNASLRLRNLGMSEDQIMRVGESRKIPDDVDIVSPADGFIISRNLMAGSRFEMGTEFYRIADLSKVWILADFTESDAHNFKPGTEAVVTVNHGRQLRARVTDALPQFNPATQTMRLRLEAGNAGFQLRPGMIVDVELPESLPRGLTVPAQALIDSGNAKRVFVDRGNGYFEPREVKTGWRSDDRVEIVSGLSKGDRVVAAGAFLVDSEARLKSIAASVPATKMN